MSQTLQATYAAKRKARRFAVQGIYEWQMSHKVDLSYYHELLTQVVANHEALDALLIPVLDRELSALDGVELATLRLGAYELKEHLEIPYRVVLDEAIELAKHFGGADSHKYINGVLDRLATTLRAAEKQQSN
jgi:transcription antitermination protein NusB